MDACLPLALGIIFLLSALPVSLSVTWSSRLPDHGTVHACPGHDVTLPWEITVGPNEGITDVQWFYEGNSSEMIAMYASGNFLTMPAYSNRVEQVSTTGLKLKHVVAGDAGNYVVGVNAYDASGTHTSFRKTAVLVVATGTGGGGAVPNVTLEITQQQVAVYDNQTGLYHVQLTCTSRGHSVSGVEWITPSGTKLASSGSTQGEFSLLLPNPVEGGSYTCRLAPEDACVLSASPGLAQDVVLVDETEARLAVLEAQQLTLSQENDRLTLQTAQCQQAGSTYAANMDALRGRVTQLETRHANLEVSNNQLKADNSRLRADNSNLTSQLSSLKTEVTRLSSELRGEDSSQSHVINDLSTKLDSCERKSATLQASLTSVQSQVTSLESRVTQQTHGQGHQGVSFHARLRTEVTVPAHTSQTITPDEVIVNQGNAYDFLTGWFTAPVTGMYFFSATVSSHSMFAFSDVRLLHEGHEVSVMDSPVMGEVGTCQAVVRVQRHERVWLQSGLNGEDLKFAPNTTALTGFLISAE